MSKPIEKESQIEKENDKKANRDPISGEIGMHAVGTGVGAAVVGGASAAGIMAAGAAMGAAGGPVGAVIGAAVGAVIGADIGKAVGEKINPTQLVWWEQNHATRPYVKAGHDYKTFEPAYRTGLEAARDNNGADFNDLAPSIKNNWNIARGGSKLEWEEARPAIEDAFQTYTTYSPNGEKR